MNTVCRGISIGRNSNQPSELKSSGTLLPLPARYFRTPPEKGLGFGKRFSLWNLNRVSSIVIWPWLEALRGLPSGDDLPFVRVYELGSSIDRGGWEGGGGGAEGADGAVTGGGGGAAGGAEGADDGGGGGGAAGELLFPKAFRAACTAIEAARPPFAG